VIGALPRQAIAMERVLSTLAVSFMLAAAVPASAVEHPGVLPKDANCSSCHANKTSGKSVHSAMATSCNVCHLTNTQGDMTTVSLAMPKAQICFACHEKSAELQQHSPAVRKGTCLDCHDAHSSDRRMLLRAAAENLLRTSSRNPDTQ
jgi:predicted CXXCH cytochrome family protein